MLPATLMPRKAKSHGSLPDDTQGKRPARRGTKYPDIVRDAKALGVSRTHLYRVLEGKRESVALLIRYQAMKGQAANN